MANCGETLGGNSETFNGVRCPCAVSKWGLSYCLASAGIVRHRGKQHGAAQIFATLNDSHSHHVTTYIQCRRLLVNGLTLMTRSSKMFYGVALTVWVTSGSGSEGGSGRRAMVEYHVLGGPLRRRAFDFFRVVAAVLYSVSQSVRWCFVPSLSCLPIFCICICLYFYALLIRFGQKSEVQADDGNDLVGELVHE